MTEFTQTGTQATLEESEPSRAKTILKWIAWAWFGLFFLTLFTLLKLPEARLKNFIHGQITSALRAQGIGFTAQQTSLSLGLGISYEMEKVALLPANGAEIRIDKVEFSPTLLSLLTGKVGGNLQIENGQGRMESAFSMRPTSNDFSVSFRIKEMDLGRLGLIAMIENLKGSALLEGNGNLSGNLGNPTTWNGEVALKPSKVVIDSQTLYGFSIPRLGISDGDIDVRIGEGKALIRKFRLGKQGSPDDITATLNGEIRLANRLESSTLNLRSRVGFSQNVMKAFVLLDAMLQAGKQSDGTYQINIGGSFDAPTVMPSGG